MAEMGEDEIKRLLAEIGRRGGKARAKVLTAKRRKQIALKASRAAAKARTEKAKKAGIVNRNRRGPDG